jgi:hypothetical protein
VSQENELKLLQEIERLKRQVERLKVGEVGAGGSWVYLTTPLTSSSWNWTAKSDASKTLLDLSVVFGAPAGIKAIIVRLSCDETGGSTDVTTHFAISPNDTSGSYAIAAYTRGSVGMQTEASGVCPCDANGDIYYQINAYGTNTMKCLLQIWGYLP